MKYDVGIIIRTYNNTKEIIDLLISILDQGVITICLLYDDCSTDNTVQKVTNFLKKYNMPYKYYSASEHVGKIASLIRVQDQLNPDEIEYIITLNQYDKFKEPNILKKMYGMIKKYKVPMLYGLTKNKIRANSCMWESNYFKQMNLCPADVTCEHYVNIFKPNDALGIKLEVCESKFDPEPPIYTNINIKNYKYIEKIWEDFYMYKKKYINVELLYNIRQKLYLNEMDFDQCNAEFIRFINRFLSNQYVL